MGQHIDLVGQQLHGHLETTGGPRRGQEPLLVERSDRREGGDAYEHATALLRRALGLQAELGEATVPSTVPLAEDPASGSFHVAALAPIGPLDQQRLLAAPGPDARLAGAIELLADEVAVLTQRLEMG